MMWMLLWAVGCGGKTGAEAAGGGKADELRVDPVPAAKSPPIIHEGPPMGEGPWNVKIAGVHVGRIFGYDADTEIKDWTQYAERRKGLFQWAKNGVSWSVEVEPKTNNIQCVASSTYDKCQAFEIERTSSGGVTLRDRLDRPQSSVAYADAYHQNGVYRVIATIPGVTPDPEARMYVAPGAPGAASERKEILCTSSAFQWAERDDQADDDDKKVTLEIIYFGELPPKLPATADDCPAGYTSYFHAYAVRLGQ
jgi:hypothetical protein